MTSRSPVVFIVLRNALYASSESACARWRNVPSPASASTATPVGVSVGGVVNHANGRNAAKLSARPPSAATVERCTLPSPSTQTPQSAPTFSLRNSVMLEASAGFRVASMNPRSEGLRVNHGQRDETRGQPQHDPETGFLPPTVRHADERGKREPAHDLHPDPAAVKMIEALPHPHSGQRDQQAGDAAPFQHALPGLRGAGARVDHGRHQGDHRENMNDVEHVDFLETHKKEDDTPPVPYAQRLKTFLG